MSVHTQVPSPRDTASSGKPVCEGSFSEEPAQGAPSFLPAAASTAPSPWAAANNPESRDGRQGTEQCMEHLGGPSPGWGQERTRPPFATWEAGLQVKGAQVIREVSLAQEKQ